MALKLSTISLIGSNNSIKLAVWATLLNGDDGAPFEFVDWADRTIQVFGTFGAGGTVVLEGSNDGVNYSTLTDSNGVAMSYTAAAVKQINEAPRYVRPRVTAGDGTTALTFSLTARRVESRL